jgi:signal transduction histidine kinase
MLSNLVLNAIQYSYEGSPVRINVQGETEEVVLEVHDEGPPIAPEATEKIFDPMMRGVVQQAEKHAHQEGLGLGLYIARHIALAHGGTIDLTSSEEQGTTVRLPGSSVDDAQPVDATSFTK